MSLPYKAQLARLFFFSVLLLALVAVTERTSAADPAEELAPNLLAEEPSGGFGPDLLEDDPFFNDSTEVMRDPIFEDDFYFSEPLVEINDPLEPLNRAFFVFNDRLYFWVLKPVTNVYSAVLPWDIRLIIGNFFANLASPISFVNNILQGEIDDAGVVLGRFLINTTLGIGGLGDPAAVDFDLQPRDADLGQTFGKWGIGEGIYINWPFFGPSNVRDSFGLVGDAYLHPVPWVEGGFGLTAGYIAVDRVNTLSLSPDVYEELKRISIDPYVAARQAFFDYRRAIINQR
jgi:phospholipid-binding lipoprotein MlaA